MPLHEGKDSTGSYIQYGKSGKKYYFKKNSIRSYNTAYKKALKQMIAIYMSGYRE